jgi:hypothetical protein
MSTYIHHDEGTCKGDRNLKDTGKPALHSTELSEACRPRGQCALRHDTCSGLGSTLRMYCTSYRVVLPLFSRVMLVVMKKSFKPREVDWETWICQRVMRVTVSHPGESHGVRMSSS